MSTYTPGPWTVTRDKKYDQQRISSGDLLVAVARAAANARLIAAAPDLLAALKIAERWCPTGPSWTAEVEQVRAAIAKAEGTP